MTQLGDLPVVASLTQFKVESSGPGRHKDDNGNGIGNTRHDEETKVISMRGIENEEEVIDVGKQRNCKQRNFNEACLAHIPSYSTRGIFRRTLLRLRKRWRLLITLLHL
ncbi:MAG: hypothetical protein E6J11_05240 [Chloroflexi bacterium]|nr:MAG: hypothetical protein E6J11_05240 [Chloroflexota bacterium]